MVMVVVLLKLLQLLKLLKLLKLLQLLQLLQLLKPEKAQLGGARCCSRTPSSQRLVQSRRFSLAVTRLSMTSRMLLPRVWELAGGS